MVDAKANPEKRLFISLITRDIGLIDAIVDLTDNSVNSAMKKVDNSFSSSADFQRLFDKANQNPNVWIDVTFDRDRVSVEDNAGGIRLSDARDEVFRFGHSEAHKSSQDRLSVYGIGMKRALFKIGNAINIVSDHKDGGFSLRLNVQDWANGQEVPWVIPISERKPAPTGTGTKIIIKDLHEEIQRRISDPKFETELIAKLSRVYSYFIGRVVGIKVNGKAVKETEFEIGDNFSHDRFPANKVDCSITAGIAPALGNKFLADSAGWFVFCNFRTVLYGDKTPITGWGTTLPLFQPKHRPFLGIASFISADPELLPWTTTKGSVNEDNAVWQEAKGRMAAVARPILRFLDSRYSDQGTEVEPSRVADMSKVNTNVFAVTTSAQRMFKPSAQRPPKEIKVQYWADRDDIELVRKHFSSSGLSYSEIGRRTFHYFLRNEVGKK